MPFSTDSTNFFSLPRSEYVDEGVRAVEDVCVVAEQIIPKEDAGVVLLEDEKRPLDVLDGSEDRLVEG